MFIEVELAEIQKSESLSHPQVVILKEKGGSRAFPIFIGYYEASALEMSVTGYVSSRPLTHDLIFNILDACNLQLTQVLVDDLRGNTFIGKLVIMNSAEEEFLVDARPSDAIVLATRIKAPILVNEDVLNIASHPPEEEEGKWSQDEDLL
jgi:hypothetical protein